MLEKCASLEGRKTGDGVTNSLGTNCKWGGKKTTR